MSVAPEPQLLPAAALEVDVSHRVGEFDLTARFRLDDGIGVLVGPLGAGKSVTLSLVAGLARPRHGRITIGGAVVADAGAGVHVPTQDRHVGMVFQESSLLPHRTVLDNVALAVRTGDRRTRRARALEGLAEVGADGFARRRPGALSGGQRQRVALARALAGEPRLLLLDEPFSALDRATREALRALVRRTVDRHEVPALFVTHDPDEAAALAGARIPVDHGTIGTTTT